MEIKNFLRKINVKNDNKFFIDLIVFLVLVFLGTAGRTLFVGWGLQPFPNFEIVMVITFLAAFFLRPNIAFLVPLLIMISSDILLGNSIFVGNQQNRIVLFTYSGFAIIALVNILNRDKFRRSFGEIKIKNFGIAAGLGIGFVILYDVWTNFGWWYLIYPHTINSLVAVFTNGIPFMIYHIISGLITFVAIALPIVSYVSKEHKIHLPLKINNIHRTPILVLTMFLIVLSFTGTAMKIPEKGEIWLENSDETSVKMVIIGEGWVIEDNIVIYNGDTVFSILETVAQRKDISLKYTYYEEFDSVLIDSINDVANGDGGKYWQYYVNTYENGEIPPMVGSDKYDDISNGDFIEWRFEIVSY